VCNAQISDTRFMLVRKVLRILKIEKDVLRDAIERVVAEVRK